MLTLRLNRLSSQISKFFGPKDLNPLRRPIKFSSIKYKHNKIYIYMLTKFKTN